MTVVAHMPPPGAPPLWGWHRFQGQTDGGGNLPEPAPWFVSGGIDVTPTIAPKGGRPRVSSS